MKHDRLTLWLAACLLALGLGACSDDETGVPPMAVPTAQGTFTDERDGETYNWVQYGNLQWMAENFRYDIGSTTDCRNYIEESDWVQYKDVQPSTRNRPKYGMYYSYAGALRACPDGWRLPSDADWQQLELALGMSPADTARTEWRGNIATNMIATKDRETYLHLLLGGCYTFHTHTSLNNGSRYKGAWGYYWTSTQDPAKGGYYMYRKFIYNRDEVFRQSMDPQAQLISVRYVRDAR